MFDNIGGKIKTLAMTLTGLGITLSIVAGVISLSDGSIEGLFIMIFGSLLSWLGSFLLYGFGQLVENSDRMVELLEEIAPEPAAPAHPEHTVPYHPSVDETVSPPVTPADWVCYSCGNTNFHKVHTCQICGVTKHWSDEKHAAAVSSIGFK
jgi:hypothetical protein